MKLERLVGPQNPGEAAAVGARSLDELGKMAE